MPVSKTVRILSVRLLYQSGKNGGALWSDLLVRGK